MLTTYLSWLAVEKSRACFFCRARGYGVVIVETEDAIIMVLRRIGYLDTVARFIEAPVAHKAGREYRIGPERPGAAGGRVLYCSPHRCASNK